MRSDARIAHHVVDLTPGRRIWLAALELQGPSHRMVGLLEVDVTDARARIADDKARGGEGLSFTGFLIACLARAVDEHKQVQAYRKGRKRLVIFDDVDVGMLIEHGGALMAHIIRRAQQRTARDIHQEIRAVQARPAPTGRGMPRWFRWALRLPWPLSVVVKAAIRALTRHDPVGLVAMSGTTFISAVGMFGKGHAGWGISDTPHSLSVFVGGIARKPAVHDGRIEPRDLLDLTVMFDHDVIDGAPATRFVRRLVELIEGAHGLEPAAAPAASPGP